jgi:uncharacterized protein YkwD
MSKTFHVWVFIVATLALSALSKAQAQAPSTNGSGVEPTVVYLAPEEAKFLALINQFRRKLGLTELRIHAGLQAAAEKHTKWMATQDIATGQDALSHFGPTPTTKFSQRIETEGYASYTMIGENVACGSGTAEETFKQFALSPAHLGNMMSPRYRHIGIARAGTGAEACPFYWTNDFGSKASPESDPPAVAITDLDRIAAAIDAVAGSANDNGLSTQQILSSVIPTVNDHKPSYSCVVPYGLGRGVLASSADTQTTIEVGPQAGSMMLKISYQQLSTNARFTSYTVSGVALVKNPFYPLVTLFSAPNTRVGGFMIQIDLASGRAQFDPYPGAGGASGLISCQVR